MQLAQRAAERKMQEAEAEAARERRREAWRAERGRKAEQLEAAKVGRGLGVRYIGVIGDGVGCVAFCYAGVGFLQWRPVSAVMGCDNRQPGRHGTGSAVLHVRPDCPVPLTPPTDHYRCSACSRSTPCTQAEAEAEYDGLATNSIYPPPHSTHHSTPPAAIRVPVYPPPSVVQADAEAEYDELATKMASLEEAIAAAEERERAQQEARQCAQQAQQRKPVAAELEDTSDEEDNTPIIQRECSCPPRGCFCVCNIHALVCTGRQLGKWHRWHPTPKLRIAAAFCGALWLIGRDIQHGPAQHCKSHLHQLPGSQPDPRPPSPALSLAGVMLGNKHVLEDSDSEDSPAPAKKQRSSGKPSQRMVRGGKARGPGGGRGGGGHLHACMWTGV